MSKKKRAKARKKMRKLRIQEFRERFAQQQEADPEEEHAKK